MKVEKELVDLNTKLAKLKKDRKHIQEREDMLVKKEIQKLYDAFDNYDVFEFRVNK